MKFKPEIESGDFVKKNFSTLLLLWAKSWMPALTELWERKTDKLSDGT